MPKGVTFLLFFFRSSNTSKQSKFSARVHLGFKIASSSVVSPLEFISPIPFRKAVVLFPIVLCKEGNLRARVTIGLRALVESFL